MMIISIQKLQHRKISTGSRLRKQPFSDIIRKVVETFSATNRNLLLTFEYVKDIITENIKVSCHRVVKCKKHSFTHR